MTASPPGAAASDCLPARPPCYTPRQLRAAYGIQPLLDRGIDGRGVTVALPEEAETGPAQGLAVTDIRQDVADFDSRLGLPPARIGVITTLAGSSASPWLAGGEEVEDTELVHAVETSPHGGVPAGPGASAAPCQAAPAARTG